MTNFIAQNGSDNLYTASSATSSIYTDNTGIEIYNYGSIYGKDCTLYTTNANIYTTDIRAEYADELDSNIYATIAPAATASNYLWVSEDNTDFITINYDYSGPFVHASPEELRRSQIRGRLKRNLSPQVLVKRFGVGRAKNSSEERARKALRDLIGGDRFKRYLKHGFVNVCGKSGRVYQVFPGHKMTKVWESGRNIEDLCVVLVDSSLPPSDSVIMRILMILDSEQGFRQIANIFPQGSQNTIHMPNAA